MSDAIVEAINAIQLFNESVVSRRNIYAPCLDKYPSTSDTAKCPIILTHAEGISFNAQIADRAQIQIVSRLLWKPIGQGQFGDTMHRVHEVMDDLRSHYTNENSYEIVGRLMLQKAPIAVEIIGGATPFTMTGYQIIEYPEGFQMWYHGFEMRFTVETNSALENC